ncbi:saccharopine dehydrogenase family protein [Thalassomonas actiniarum]|uniref:Saccharopine dehydrogenase NADP-binding domain-containing protein n=1 Tax=Thalassomonas actiniarum TaxID=485447 RepID=A0AAE9YM90_9GAMM|nr:saccharopine dehydrogenase NADP-binding domain-containing protein [Thalassomonas actiniarum]WDD97865.1 saccharopine dehydrogenase NADP-binding domain-containing protein [Thalassomonas actiniarum]
MKTVLVLGGYGNFGKRIVENLADIEHITILVAGRNLAKAQGLADKLQPAVGARLNPYVIDINAGDFEARLKLAEVDVVIHTGGPFQGQGHLVPQMCARVGAHYIDLADDRRFVCDITDLDALAKQQQVLLVSGASSVPGLSSAVIDHYCQQFFVINNLDIAIAPGNKAERGEATVKGILSYTGHAFSVYKGGLWQDAFGWMEPRKKDFGDIIGKRWLANVDVPDLELFPARYRVTDSVRFQAGLELPFLHLSMVVMAYLAKKGWVKNWSPLSKSIVKASNVFMPFGSDNGAMQVLISGLDRQKQRKTIKWSLYAPGGIGPYIPTLAAIILARKLLLEQTAADPVFGATPCTGLFSLADFTPYFDKLGIYQKEDVFG